MNTVKSVYYGWAAFIAAGGGAYYFAKKSINADRAAKAEADLRKRQAIHQLEQEHFNSQYQNSPQYPQRIPPKAASRPDANWGTQTDEASHPSREASSDPAPTRHAPEDEAQKVREKSKYEATEVFRARKGDRFS